MAAAESRPDGLWKHYWATWRTMFAIQTVTLVLSLSIAIPIISLATSRALTSSEDARLSDIDLLDFLTGPSVPFIVAAIITPWIIVHIFGYSAQLYAAHASLHDADVSFFTALRKTTRACPSLIRLACRFFLKVFIVALPFLLVMAGVIMVQFRNEGLTYFLIHRPPDFLFAVALLLSVGVLMMIAILRITVTWVHALPLVLFRAENPATAYHISQKKSRPDRRKAFFSFALWAFGTPLLVILLNSVWLPLALWASEVLGHRLGLLALLLSLLILCAFVIATLVGFINLTLLAIQHVRIYRHAGLDHDDPPATPDPIVSSLVRWGIVVALAVIGIFTIGLSYRWLDRLRIADDARIIALRGASDDSPENTVTAIRRAIDLGAHDVAIDVQSLSNKVLVVFADSDFIRIANDPLKLRDATEEELAAIDIGSWMHPKYREERVPRLDTAIGLLDDHSGLMLLLPEIADQKERRAFFAKLIELLDWTGISPRTRLVCASLEHVPELHAIRPNLKVGFLSTTPLDRPIKVPVNFVIVPAETLSNELIKKLHRQDIEVIGTDTRDPVIMSAVLSRGADGLLVKVPRIGRKVLEERATLNPGERLLIEFVTRIREFLPSSKTPVSVSE
ncbi:glycerophosphodiester phosphodiesterase [Haloferula chungangensis]|uniref:Glycerophosphodiester phosphodiesterase n=1 Tax=Haloferula chungangensis TaxID=1048331 RepID=A0ABW2LAC0_9BACT